MEPKERLKKKIIRKSISVKLLLISAVATSIPIILSGVLVVLSYEGAIKEFLVEQKIELTSEIRNELLLKLHNIKIQAALTLFIVIALTLFSIILIARNFTNSLRNLIKGTEEIARGNLDYIIKVETEDEVGELTGRFNQMTQQLKKAKAASEEAKTALEIQVEARTKELKDLAEGLENQIQERMKELQQRVWDMERLHKLTVGRELRMIELKKEIKNLKEELEKLRAEKK